MSEARTHNDHQHGRPYTATVGPSQVAHSVKQSQERCVDEFGRREGLVLLKEIASVSSRHDAPALQRRKQNPGFVVLG